MLSLSTSYVLIKSSILTFVLLTGKIGTARKNALSLPQIRKQREVSCICTPLGLTSSSSGAKGRASIHCQSPLYPWATPLPNTTLTTMAACIFCKIIKGLLSSNSFETLFKENWLTSQKATSPHSSSSKANESLLSLISNL